MAHGIGGGGTHTHFNWPKQTTVGSNLVRREKTVCGHSCIELSECVDAHCNCNGLWEDLSVWYKEVYLRERLGKHHGALTVSFICHTESLMGHSYQHEFDLKCVFLF